MVRTLTCNDCHAQLTPIHIVNTVTCIVIIDMYIIVILLITLLVRWCTEL